MRKFEIENKLNKSIEQGDDYNITYKISTELDELITKYYKQLNDKKRRQAIEDYNIKPFNKI